MIATKKNFRMKPLVISDSRRPDRAVLAEPNQSMTIAQIVDRFLKGVPASGKRYEGVYIDQDEMDLEKVSRMDFAEKHALQRDMEQRAANAKAKLKASEEAKRVKEAEERAERRAAKKAATTGIGPLDNTMPGDTKLKTK